MYLQRLLLFFLLCFYVPSFAQFNIPEKPSSNEQTAVFDYAKILSPKEKKQLERKLIGYADSTSTQIVIATIPSLKGENEGILTPKWAHQWGIGQKDQDNGVFILLAEEERKIWISPGYGLEHILTAGINGEIIRNYIIPEFKKGNYYSGLDIGTDKLIELFSGTYKAKKQENDGEFPLWTIIIIVIVILFLISLNNKNGGNSSRGNKSQYPDLGDIIILSRMGRSRGGGFRGGFGGGFGGGFSGGFGGGGFSGGGAGGSW